MKIFAIFECPEGVDEVNLMSEVNQILITHGATLTQCGTYEALETLMKRKITNACTGDAVAPKYIKERIDKEEGEIDFVPRPC